MWVMRSHRLSINLIMPFGLGENGKRRWQGISIMKKTPIWSGKVSGVQFLQL